MLAAMVAGFGFWPLLALAFAFAFARALAFALGFGRMRRRIWESVLDGTTRR